MLLMIGVLMNRFKKLRLALAALALLAAGAALAQDTLRIGLVLPPEGEGPAGELARDALQGATFAVAEFEFNAMLVNLTLDVQIEHAATAQDAVTAANRLAEGETELVGIRSEERRVGKEGGGRGR